MKRFSISTTKKHDESLLSLRRSTKEYFEDSIMDSKTFADEWEPYIRDISLTKETKKSKFFRPQDYASIGVLDRNDLIQEGYLAFMKAYNLSLIHI